MSNTPAKKTIAILGTRGIPASHGGFETFAEGFSIHLAKHGWKVSVYCQEIGVGPIRTEVWNGVERIIIPTQRDTSIGSIIFDFKATLHARKNQTACLTLGYNTAIFNILLKGRGIRTIMNMDGIEWAREKWSIPARIWLYINEFLGAKISDILIADHPEIAKHLSRHTSPNKIRTIAYGASYPANPCTLPLQEFGVEPGKYAVMIARPEPENSVLEIVTAWSSQVRGIPLIVLGNYSRHVPFQNSVINAASKEVHFVGAIYDKQKIEAIRGHALFYIHGHRVGGTNPSLIEAMACGNPIIAHDNKFNRWVANDGALYFKNIAECDQAIHKLISSKSTLLQLSHAAKERHSDLFTLEKIHQQYEDVCMDSAP